jgi:hypothetical protein
MVVAHKAVAKHAMMVDASVDGDRAFA